MLLLNKRICKSWLFTIIPIIEVIIWEADIHDRTAIIEKSDEQNHWAIKIVAFFFILKVLRVGIYKGSFRELIWVNQGDLLRSFFDSNFSIKKCTQKHGNWSRLAVNSNQGKFRVYSYWILLREYLGSILSVENRLGHFKALRNIELSLEEDQVHYIVHFIIYFFHSLKTSKIHQLNKKCI